MFFNSDVTLKLWKKRLFIYILLLYYFIESKAVNLMHLII